MQFLNPGSLWLLLLGIIPVLLYLFRRRSRKFKVSTLVFFKSLAKEHQESAWLRRLKKWLSLLLTLLVLSFSIFVLSRLVVTQDDLDQYRTVVILLDRSASMSIKDDSGETRVDAAKRVLKERLRRVPEEVGVALIVYDTRPEVLQPRTVNRRELVSRLEGVEPRPINGRRDAALESARLIAGLQPPSVIWHLSDSLLRDGEEAGEEAIGSGPAGTPPRETIAPDFPVREFNLALPEVINAGITAVQLRPAPLEYSRYDAFVQIALNADAPHPAKIKLNVSVGGIPSQYREMDLEPGERSALNLRINGSRDQLLRIWIETERDDFDLDNQVLMLLPENKPIVAAWIRPEENEDPYTRSALSAMQETGTFEVLKGNPEAWPLPVKVDAVIFDGWLPPEWPVDIPAVVINPPGPSGPILARKLAAAIPYDSVRVGNETHPVLFRVSSGRVAITQTVLFETLGSLEPLWFAGKETILAAGEVNGQRIVVMGFSPGLSESLPLTASFPILMGNALFWSVDQKDLSAESRIFATGELVRVSGDILTWTEVENREVRKRRIPIQSDVIEMDRIGVWETDSGLRGASQLLSEIESDIPASSAETQGDYDYFAVKGGIAGNLKLWLLSAVCAILLLESWLFHRYAFY